MKLAKHEKAYYRQRLAEKVETFYREMGVESSDVQKKLLKNIGKTPLNEVIHGCMLPHLGVYRIPLISAERGATVFFCHDLYEHDWYPEIRTLSFCRRGVPPSGQSNAISIPLEKNKPIRFVKPPTRDTLLGLKQRIEGRYAENFAYARSIGLALSHKDLREIFDVLDKLIDLMIDISLSTKNYASFCVKLWINMIKQTNPELYDRILFCPFYDSLEIFKDELEELVKVDFPHLWYYCPEYRRNRVKVCPKCHEGYRFVVPDIVAYQALTSILGLEGRAVGGIKDYSMVADEFSEKLFHTSAPHRYVVSASPRFFGIGEPKGGYTRASVLRVLLEVEAESLGPELLKKEPIVVSRYWKFEDVPV